MAKTKRLSTFNRFSVGRAAVLFRRGDATRASIAQHYFKRYGKKWKISTLEEMEEFLFNRIRRTRPQFGTLFENKTPKQITENYQKWAMSAKANAERMRLLHQDPKFAKAHAKRTSKRMRLLHQDPKFAEANAKRASKRMRLLHQDPKFAEANAERMRLLNQDPEFKKRRFDSMQKRFDSMRKSRHALSAEFDMRGVSPTEEPAIRKEMIETIRKAITSLPRIQKEAITEIFYTGKPVSRVAQEMGISVKEAERILNAAYSTLARKLKGRI